MDIRYRRQTHELIVRFPPGPITSNSVIGAVRVFEETYEALYGKGSGFRQAGVELTTFRVEAIGRTRKPAPSRSGAATAGHPESAPLFEPLLERWMTVEVWQWLDLPIGHRASGPAVIEHPETTVYVGGGQAALVDPLGNLSIDLTGGAPHEPEHP